MSEAKLSDERKVALRRIVDAKQARRHMLRPSELSALLNENETLWEQVRLYELAAERGWQVYKDENNNPWVWHIENKDTTFLSAGRTPTAAIAAAEKKEKAHGNR